MTDICKAWRTEALGVVSLVYAATRLEAKRATVRAAAACGCDIDIADVRASRTPSRDGPQAQCQRRKCLEYTESEVPR